MTRIRAQVGDERVLAAVSGGVDSSVAAALVHKAIGDQLVSVFVDTGLLRKNEPEQVRCGVPRHTWLGAGRGGCGGRILRGVEGSHRAGAEAKDRR